MERDFEDDGRVVADMSDIEPQPLLMPKLGGRGRRESRAPEQEAPNTSHLYDNSVHLDGSEKRAMIGGALAAALTVGLVLAAAFAGVILLITHM